MYKVKTLGELKRKAKKSITSKVKRTATQRTECLTSLDAHANKVFARFAKSEKRVAKRTAQHISKSEVERVAASLVLKHKAALELQGEALTSLRTAVAMGKSTNTCEAQVQGAALVAAKIASLIMQAEGSLGTKASVIEVEDAGYDENMDMEEDFESSLEEEDFDEEIEEDFDEEIEGDFDEGMEEDFESSLEEDGEYEEDFDEEIEEDFDEEIEEDIPELEATSKKASRGKRYSSFKKSARSSQEQVTNIDDIVSSVMLG